jgi:16S rRNA (adenine1518-N6/adenine1519-N6)-dimethyltransferase
MMPPTPRPRKGWGQHFLIDPNIRRKIIDAAQVVPGERVIEIGPGRGALTHGLLALGAQVLALEIDPLLVAAFSPVPPELRMVCADALAYRYEEVEAPFKVVANLPYNISTPLLFRLMEERSRIARMVLMLQKEVAARLCAGVGDEAYGALSVTISCYADVEKVCDVALTCFRPRPKVDSTVIRVIPRSTPRVPIGDEAHFARVVRAAFGYRRKQLPSALRDAGFEREPVAAAFRCLGIDTTRRGETLSLYEFARLSDTLADEKRRGNPD